MVLFYLYRGCYRIQERARGSWQVGDASMHHDASMAPSMNSWGASMPSSMLSKVADSSTPDSCSPPGLEQVSQDVKSESTATSTMTRAVLDVFPSESKAGQQWFQTHGQLLNGSSCCLLSLCFGIEVYAKLVGQRNQAINHRGTHEIHTDHRKNGVCQVVHRRTHQLQTFHPRSKQLGPGISHKHQLRKYLLPANNKSLTPQSSRSIHLPLYIYNPINDCFVTPTPAPLDVLPSPAMALFILHDGLSKTARCEFHRGDSRPCSDL